jgi:hypothetical protein
MKRNFLLMLLLTLLPMAIWAAEPISSVKLAVADVPYGTEELTQANFLANWDTGLVFGTDVIWDGKIYSENGTLVEDLATAPVGKYYVTFTGGRYYEGTVNVNFKILKQKLYVSVNGEIVETDAGLSAGNLFTTFGVPFDLDDIEGVEDVEGLVNDEEFDDVVEGEITAITTEETDANADDAGHAFLGANPYTATLEGLTSQNYEIICVNPFYIKQKNISDGEGLTFLLDPKSATFNGEVQEPVYQITYGNAVLVQGEDGDFTVTYPEEGQDFDGPVNVGNYPTAIVGHGNFIGTYTEVEQIDDSDPVYGENFVWSIKPYGLTIITKNQTKVYNGQPGLPSNAQDVAYEVLLPYHLSNYNGLGLESIELTPQDKDEVGEYTISANIPEGSRNDNYDYNFVNEGKLTITKRNMTITVGEIEKTYNANDNLATATITFTPELEKDENGDDIEWAIPTSDEKNARYSFVKGTYTNNNYAGADLKVSRKESGEDIGDYAITVTVSDAQKGRGRLKNYNITEIIDGVLHIMGGKIYVTALSTEKNYGDPDPETFTYRVDGLVGNDKLLTEPTLTREGAGTEEGEAVGQYRIVPTGAVAPANYKDIVYADGKFTINQRPITITLASQTMKDGDRTSTLDQTAYTLEGTLAPGDEASDLFNLKLVPYEIATEGTEGQEAQTAQNALVKFTSWSSANLNDQDAQQYGKGVVEVKDYDEFLEATKVTVKRNIAVGATTGAQAQAFEDKDFYIGLQATYNDDGEVVDVPVGARQELLYSLDADEAETGIYAQILEETTPGTYTFKSYSAPTEGELWGEGVVELEAYDPTSGLAKLTVTENNAPLGASQQAQTDALAFVGRTFFVAANPDDEIPQDRLQLLSQSSRIYIAIGETVRPKLEEKEYIAPVEPGEESGVYVTDANTKKEAVALREDLDDDVATYTPGIYVNILDAAKWANYKVTNGGDIDYVYGEDEAQVTVPAATLYVITKDALVLDTRDTELAQKIEEADGEEKFVAFANRTLRAGQWNVLVLPFETSVAELSETFGYAVVDMLDETNATTSTVKLSLAFGEIPANTPFLVQPAEDVVLSDGIFFEKEVVYSENPEAVDMAGHHYVGTYTGHNVTSEDKSEYYYSISAKAFVNSTSSTRIGSTGAYLKDDNAGTPNEVRYISIQDPDGEENVTAIGEIAADAASKADANADGWYNVQGMKLNAAPTQRGIYIKDGKKVLVK